MVAKVLVNTFLNVYFSFHTLGGDTLSVRMMGRTHYRADRARDVKQRMKLTLVLLAPQTTAPVQVPAALLPVQLPGDTLEKRAGDGACALATAVPCGRSADGF